MSAVRPELRTPVMTLVEASWEDSGGASQKITARMEDRSAGGACIRLKTPIPAGLKIRIEWRFDQFTGTARYCRREGKEYLVGIQRDRVASSVSDRQVRAPSPQQKSKESETQVFRIAAQKPPQLERNQILLAAGMTEMERFALPRVAAFIEPVQRLDRRTLNWTVAPAIAHPPDIPPPRPIDPVPRARKPQAAGESNQERKPMGRRWLELAPWHSKQDSPGAHANEESKASDADSSDRNSEKENRMHHSNQLNEKSPAPMAREVPNFQVELLPMEDIYRMAGIMNPRRGYSIIKVVEMLRSEHMQGLSKELKQAAVLMALEAAGVSLDQVQQDAKARQDAMDSYEASQRKQVEAVWARKAEEVVQIQAELESVKAHHQARISRNLEGVTREKAAFNNWLMLKQQECESMAEAVEMCLRSPAVSEPAITPVAEIGKEKAIAAAVGAKPL